MHYEGQDSAGQAAFGLDETAGHHDNQDDANAEGGARRQGLDQTMHGCRRKVYWVGARIWGDWVECFHNKPSIPNPSTESYSNGKTRVEVFVPAVQRHYGYYVLPILQGDRFIGRIDMTHRRQAGKLYALGLWLEPGQRLTDGRHQALGMAL